MASLKEKLNLYNILMYKNHCVHIKTSKHTKNYLHSDYNIRLKNAPTFCVITLNVLTSDTTSIITMTTPTVHKQVTPPYPMALAEYLLSGALIRSRLYLDTVVLSIRFCFLISSFIFIISSSVILIFLGVWSHGHSHSARNNICAVKKI